MNIEKPVSLVDHVVSSVLASIASGEFNRGEKLPTLSAIKKNLAVSTSTVREAFKRLESLGIVEIKQGNGTYVRDFSINRLLAKVLPILKLDYIQLNDLVEARMIVESETARIAAERASDESIAKLYNTLSDMKSIGDDYEAYSQLDQEFHIEIAKATGNAFLVDFILLLRDIMKKQQEYIAQFPDVRKISQIYHERIANAIGSHDSVEARLAMEEHLSNFSKRLFDSELYKKRPTE